MNRFFATTGLLVLGAASLNAAYAPGLSHTEKSKPWSVSASLRGFYDDNYVTAPKSLERDSFGFEVSPTASLNLPLDQTFIGLSYIYSMRYYEDRINNSADHTHQFNGKLDHAFSERYKMTLNDNFVIAQEPTVIDPSGIITSPLRTDGNNIRNTASAGFTAQLTQLLGLNVNYDNTFYDYEEEGFTGSRSATLDRMEHLAQLNLRWQMYRTTVGILGYEFGAIEYTEQQDALMSSLFGLFTLPPEYRNNYSHKVYVGVDQTINSQLNASLRVGAAYTDRYNAEKYNSNVDGQDVSPYVDASLTYTYAAGSYFQAGVRHSRNPTDIIFALDQETTAVYGSVTHRLTGKITGSLLAQFQHSETEGGVSPLPFSPSFPDTSDNFFIVAANLSYRINPNWSAETGYNFDRLDSDLGGRSYTRNRVYVGIRATY